MNIGIIHFVIYIVLIAVEIVHYLITDFYIHLRIKGLFKKRLIFSPKRVVSEVEKLHKQIKKKGFKPHVVVAIGGKDAGGKNYPGGGIVGFLLASNKYLWTEDVLYLDYLRPASEEDRRTAEANEKTFNDICNKIINRIKNEVGRILIVDDWSKSGETITDVKKRLSSCLGQNDSGRRYIIKVAVIVKKENQERLEDINWNENFYCYDTDREVEFPWHA